MSKINHTISSFKCVRNMKKILVNIVSNSLGDTIAAMPYIDKFRVDFSYDVYVKINNTFTFLFLKSYPNLKFVNEDNGSYDKTIDIQYQFHKNVQEGYAHQLGYKDWSYIRPKIDFEPTENSFNKKYISVGIHSTSQLKYWNNPLGKEYQSISPYWTMLFKKLKKSGYLPVVVERDEMFGVPPHRNGQPSSCAKKIGGTLQESMNHIYHSEFFIGLSSGMSWVAHAMGKPVVIISNFTEDWNEFDLDTEDYIRVTNKSVCHGCWNKIGIEHEFDSSDWYWCPKHKDTPRQFECHTSITPDMVYNKIKHWLL